MSLPNEYVDVKHPQLEIPNRRKLKRKSKGKGFEFKNNKGFEITEF